MFDVVLFDFDGVLRHWRPERVPAIEQATGLPVGSIRPTAFSDSLLPLATTGQISDDAWRARVAEELAQAHPGADAAHAVAEWSSSIGVIDPEMLEIIRACRSQRRVGLITNATSRLDQDMDALGVGGEFDIVINSSVVGAIKPDRRLFDYAVSTFDTEHQRVVFIDDTPGHVEAAQSLGLVSMHHQSNEATRSWLIELGVL